MTTENDSKAASAPPMFDQWGRGMDSDPRLTLIVYNPDRKGAPLEWRDLDIRTLPGRPDLLARLPERMRDRMMKEAAAAMVSKYLVGVPIIAEEIGSDDPADYVSIPVFTLKTKGRRNG